MPTKKSSPKIKVEEVPESVEPKVTEKTAASKGTEDSQTPKISSFSQLDAPASVAPMQEKPATETVVPEPASENAEENKETVQTEEEKMSSQEIKDWLKDIRPDTTKDVEKKGSFNFRLFFIFLLVFAVLGALVGGVFYYKQNVSINKTGNETPTEVVSVTAAPTEQPKASVDVAKLSVNVLNGSGIKGEASKVKDLLVKGGFTADKIDTGNAKTYDYKTTSVSLKKELPDEVFDKVKESLGTSYNVEKAVGSLDSKSSYDIEITVGKK